jgi:uncharacterized protein YceK
MKNLAFFAVVLILLTGCASVFGRDVQTIRVIATCNVKSVHGQCSLENKKWLWEVNAPGSVTAPNDISGKGFNYNPIVKAAYSECLGK